MKLILSLFSTSTVVIAAAILMAGLQLSPTAQVILHFDTAGQPDFMGTQSDVILLLATGGVMLLINLFLARVFDQRERFIAVVIASFSLLLSILLFIGTSVIIVNNK